MSTNNPYKVLVTSGNLAPLATGLRVQSLALGQIGVFNRDTNLSIDGTVLPRAFFLAVGIDSTGDKTMNDVAYSAGQEIQTRHLTSYNWRPHTAGRPMIFEIEDYVGKCDAEFGISLEFRNSEIYQRQGFTPFKKSYIVKTSCCDGCETCPTGDANEVSLLLVQAVNADTDSLVTGEIIARSALTIATHGTSVNYASGAVMTEADVLVLIAYNKAQTDATLRRYTNMRFTVETMAINKYCCINLKYKKTRETLVIPSFIDGFHCSGVISVTQTVAYEEGNPYDLKEKEYEASGWNGTGVYRVSAVHGLPLNSINSLVDDTKFYDQFCLGYDQFSQSGWQEYLNPLETIVAIPDNSTVTRNGLATILDRIAITRGFNAKADDVALADIDETVVEAVADIDSSAEDGLG